jgi:hypothetical protein
MGTGTNRLRGKNNLEGSKSSKGLQALRTSELFEPSR